MEELKPDYGRFADGRCTNCFRKICECGNLLSFRACSKHPENGMRVKAIPIVTYRAAPNPIHPEPRETHYVNIAECEVFGCDTVRAIKYQENLPRNQNRKTQRKRK